MIVDMYGQVLNSARPNLLMDTADAEIRATSGAELVVVQGLPERVDLVKFGQSYRKLTDAVACVTAIPTTTAPHALWNGEPAGGKSYVIDSIGWTCTTSAAAASMFAMLCQIDRTFYTAGQATKDTATLVAPMNGRGAAGVSGPSKAVSSHTVTVISDGWTAVGNQQVTALTATVGMQLFQQLQGLWIVPPGALFCAAIIAVNTTAAGQLSVYWHEVQLPNLLS